MVDFKIKTISPVHIGSGDKYDASEYFLDVIKTKDKHIKVFKRIIHLLEIKSLPCYKKS